jgi:hypothetical protein
MWRSAVGAPARHHVIPGEVRQAWRRRRGWPSSRTASRHRDALRVSDEARRSLGFGLELTKSGTGVITKSGTGVRLEMVTFENTHPSRRVHIIISASFLAQTRL